MATKILVVDDDPNICDLLRLYFENEGYEVKTANDGSEGVNFFKMYEPDLVLLDVMLPKLDGFSVCKKIREGSIGQREKCHRCFKSSELEGCYAGESKQSDLWRFAGRDCGFWHL